MTFNSVKHVICEGPDGAGKSTLIEKLKGAFQLENYPRFSDSKTGPRDNLASRVEVASSSLFNSSVPFILDRHPLLSEMVYGPILRGRPVDPHFVDVDWVSSYSQGLMKRSVVVFCLPPLPKVRVNVRANVQDQMPGVIANIDALYTCYLSMAARWGGPHFIYDYTRSTHAPLLRRYLIDEGIK